jgi:hypothetical protein
VVAAVELLERRVVSVANRGDEVGVGGLDTCCGDQISIPARGIPTSREPTRIESILNIV